MATARVIASVQKIVQPDNAIEAQGCSPIRFKYVRSNLGFGRQNRTATSASPIVRGISPFNGEGLQELMIGYRAQDCFT